MAETATAAAGAAAAATALAAAVAGVSGTGTAHRWRGKCEQLSGCFPRCVPRTDVECDVYKIGFLCVTFSAGIKTLHIVGTCSDQGAADFNLFVECVNWGYIN